MRKYLRLLFAINLIPASSVVLSQQPVVITSLDADQDSRTMKGPYELTFADFEWQSGDAREVEHTRGNGEGERIPTGKAIAMFLKRVEQWPKDYASRSILGELMLRRASEEDDLPSYAAALGMFRESRLLNPSYKPAIVGTAKVMMAQHQFFDALREILTVAPMESQRPAEIAMMVDCHLELGELEKARSLLDHLVRQEKSPPVDARLARLAEVSGDRTQAISLIRNALEAVKRGGDSEDEWLWYQWRLSGLLFEAGELEQSESLTQSILDRVPTDARSSVLRARIAFAKHQQTYALDLLKKLAASNPSPPTLALVGELCLVEGDVESANQYWNQAEELIRHEASIAKAAHAREAAIFFADSNRNLDEALELILLDRKQRHDAITVDAHAWILFKLRRLTEANGEIGEALTLAPDSLTCRYHATKICQAMGRSDDAKRHLQKILDTNPRFSIAYSEDIDQLKTHWNLTPRR